MCAFGVSNLSGVRTSSSSRPGQLGALAVLSTGEPYGRLLTLKEQQTGQLEVAKISLGSEVFLSSDLTSLRGTSACRPRPLPYFGS